MINANEEHLTALQKMRELLADPKAWIKGLYALRFQRSRQTVSPTDETATCFCLAGAARRVWNDERVGVAMSGPEVWLQLQLEKYVPGFRGGVPNWNDDHNRTHADVLEFLDSRIQFYKEALNAKPN